MKLRTSIGLLLLATFFLRPTASRASDPSRDQVVGLVTTMLKSWETDNVDTFAGSFGKDSIFAYPGGRLSKAELTDMFKKYQLDHKDIKIYIGLFIVEGKRFAAQYQFAATDRASGKRQAVGTGIAGVIQNGKLAVYKEYWDQHILNWQEEGKIPLDEGQIFPAPASVTLGPERIN